MIHLNNAGKRYGAKILLDNASFHLRPGERVGLVGPNGAGKTTLFRILDGEESLDAGDLRVRKGARVARLRQELDTGDEPVVERVLRGDRRYHDARVEMLRLESEAAQPHADPEAWSRKYGDVQHEFERLGGYGREAKAREILAGLGFRNEQMDEPLTKFSGGWRMRVELAQLLLLSPDVLLLDEPTNHLDLQSVVWLESFLKSHEGTLLLISHDRRFLNNLVERIFELDRGALTVYAGDYEDYVRLKAEREMQLEAAAANQQRRIAEIERFVERFRAKNTKAAQVQSRIKMLDKMERVETAKAAKTVDFRFPQPPRAGRIVVDLRDVRKSYGPTRVYDGLSVKLERGWKVALVGVNGAGKSTLLKLMAGVLPPDAGEIVPGHNVTRAYYSQHHAEVLDPDLTVLETIHQCSPHLTLTAKRGILGAFLFSGDSVDKKVGVLSGGERSRLALARMLVSPAPFLLLDEPTNHLDMTSCEVLAAALADYEGSLCAISHDRDFLDGLINRVWEVSAGSVREYIGNYSDYEQSKATEAARNLSSPAADEAKAATAATKQAERDRKRAEAEERNRRYRAIKPLQERLGRIESRMEALIAEKEALNGRLADAALYDPARKDELKETLARKQSLEKEERESLAQWEELTAEMENIGNDKE